jgi:hypothetical protein
MFHRNCCNNIYITLRERERGRERKSQNCRDAIKYAYEADSDRLASYFTRGPYFLRPTNERSCAISRARPRAARLHPHDRSPTRYKRRINFLRLRDTSAMQRFSKLIRKAHELRASGTTGNPLILWSRLRDDCTAWYARGSELRTLPLS